LGFGAGAFTTGAAAKKSGALVLVAIVVSSVVVDQLHLNIITWMHLQVNRNIPKLNPPI
jgi:hypothetical protein